MRQVGIRIALVSGLLLAVAGVWLWYATTGYRYSAACRDAFRRSAWKELAASSQAWSEAEPGNSDAWWYRAEAAQREEDVAAACQFLEHVSPDAANGRRALELRIDFLLGPLNRPQAAADACQTLLQHVPDSRLAHQRLIFYYAFTLQRRKLTDQIRDAVTHTCEPKEAYAYLFLADSLRLSNGGSQNARWLESDPDSELFAVAQAVHIAETLEGSIPRDDPEVLAKVKEAFERRDRTLNELLVKYPKNLELLAYFLRRALEQGDVNRVKELLTKAPQTAEEDNRFWRYRGWLLQSYDELQQAEVAYQKALKLHPMDWGTRHLLAGLMRRKGDLAESARLEKLVIRAGELRRDIQEQQSVRAITPQSLRALANYAADCGDTLIADSLRAQLKHFGQSRGPTE